MNNRSCDTCKYYKKDCTGYVNHSEDSCLDGYCPTPQEAPEAAIRAAASKMAEALKLAQELLERNGVHRPEIDAVLAMYYKVGGK